MKTILFSVMWEIPFLNQDISYHCPIYAVLNFSKPRTKSYVRTTWSYDQGDSNLLKQKASSTNWADFYDIDVNKHAQNLSDYIISIAMACIPYKQTRIRSN